MNRRNNRIRKHGFSAAQRDPEAYITATRGIGGVLASLWRRIQYDLGISGQRFEILLQDFLARAKKGMPTHRVGRHFTRGNLRRELEKETLTFKVFMKAMKLIRIKHVRLAVELTHSTGKITLHQTEIDLGSAEFNEALDNEEDAEGGSDKHED